MSYPFSAFATGLVFGIGLLVSGMANPEKVLGFLDLAGPWDPSLAFVMVGAILVGLVAFTIARRRVTSFLGQPIRLPTATQVDRKLVVGALLFGVGWGLAGFCPGPALVALGAGKAEAAIFVVAMVVGMAFHDLFQGRIAKAVSPAAGQDMR
ncbi:hypothetical protein RE428_22740 [Marinobacter nanhaiticus D15-8W]|uniref:YeeE/YedE family protein n=1 Tax=Marinobacter nanhaiticus D15-8W TaxID=626887 RepID=N6W190_9GAMM|nr:YeeE/YedE family protein [Marinobacter nanhaiticus]ENO13879.1 YeeE/YedE family protein [Marinobacter nanhaiticus D15-8W]BES71256.1 hypothetical protein RE428_22740 [Marinobacter nanhaiticus D15-8W]